MIKGKVIEVHSRYSILAVEDGSFQKIKNYGDMAIGQRILATEEDLYMESRTNRFFSFRQMAVIAAMLIFVSVFSTVYVMDQLTAYASVVVDVNPRIEILINKNDEVLSAKALNDDGLGFDLNTLKGLRIENAIEVLVNQVGSQGYLKGQDAYVLITTVPLKDMSESSKKELNDKIISTINGSAILQKTNVAVTQITKTQLDLSKAEGVPAGLITFETGDDSGKTVSVQEFFKAEDNQKAFSSVGTVVKGAQADAVSSATQGGSQSDDSTAELREDLLERLNKLKQVPNASTGIKDFISKAERYFGEGIGDLKALAAEARTLWDGVKDNAEVEDSSGSVTTTPSGSSDSESVSHLRSDLAERLTKLKGLANPSDAVTTLIKQAEAYFSSGTGDLVSLEAEARRLWEQFEDQDNISDDDDSDDDNDDEDDEDDDDEDDEDDDSGDDDIDD